MINNKIHLRSLLILTLLYVCIGILLFFSRNNKIYQYGNILFQISILAILSYIAGIVFLKSRHVISVLFFMLLDFLFILLLYKLNVGSMGVRIWISAALYYKYSLKFRFPVSLFLSLIYFISGIFLLNSNSVYGIFLDRPVEYNKWFLFISQIFIFTVCIAYRKTFDKAATYKETIKLKEKNIEHLTDTNLGFQEFALKIENESRLEERLDITREIHDIVGYTLTSISMMLEYGEDLLLGHNEKELLELLSTARQQARNGHNEIRKALKELRKIEDSTLPFFNRIYKIVDNFRKVTLMDIDLELTNLKAESCKRYENFILRFLQEGLTNSNRHGKASKVKIIFFQDDNFIIINMEDNGNGSTEIIEGIGLKGMSERIEKKGGTIRYHSSKSGFSLIARLPVEQI